jgi:LSD1 subclass zinc finger protein
MAKDTSIRAFKCPTCGAPLEPVPGAQSMKCGYCGGTVVIPDSLRAPLPSAPDALPQYNFGRIDMNAMLTQTALFPRVFTLAQQRKFDEAAQIYSQLTGLAHEAALKAVKGMTGSSFGQ